MLQMAVGFDVSPEGVDPNKSLPGLAAWVRLFWVPSPSSIRGLAQTSKAAALLATGANPERVASPTRPGMRSVPQRLKRTLAEGRRAAVGIGPRTWVQGLWAVLGCGLERWG
jgi:hypothetical protein